MRTPPAPEARINWPVNATHAADPPLWRPGNFKNSFRTTLGDCVSSWPGAFKNAGYITTGMGKVYHPGHPKLDDGNLSCAQQRPMLKLD